VPKFVTDERVPQPESLIKPECYQSKCPQNRNWPVSGKSGQLQKYVFYLNYIALRIFALRIFTDKRCISDFRSLPTVA